MKLKKCLALGLIFITALSVTACGDKAEKSKEEVKEEVKEDKHTYYDSYFTDMDFALAGESMKIKTDGAEVAILQAKDNSNLFRFGIGEALYELYEDKNGQIYVHAKIPSDEGEAADVWYRYNDEDEAEEEKDVFDSMTSYVDKSTYEIDKESIVKVKYVETDKNGLDHIKVSMKNPEYDPEANSVQYNIKFNFENQECTMTVIHSSSDGITSNVYTNKNIPESFDTFDYGIDLENKKWIARDDDNKDIPFEIISTSGAINPEYIDADIFVDGKTHKITKMIQTIDSIETVIEFSNPSTCEKEVTIPETVGECTGESIVMLYLAVTMSSLGGK